MIWIHNKMIRIHNKRIRSTIKWSRSTIKLSGSTIKWFGYTIKWKKCLGILAKKLKTNYMIIWTLRSITILWICNSLNSLNSLMPYFVCSGVCRVFDPPYCGVWWGSTTASPPEHLLPSLPPLLLSPGASRGGYTPRHRKGENAISSPHWN